MSTEKNYRENSDTDYHYFQFPLSLLRNFFDQKDECIRSIINYGIYRFAENIDFDVFRVADLVVYDNYMNHLPRDIRTILKRNCPNFWGKNNTQCFDGLGEYDVDCDERNEVVACLRKNTSLFDKLELLYKFRTACRALNIPNWPSNEFEVGRKIADSILPNEPMPMVKLELLLNFYNEEKSEYEIAQLLGFIAIKSILGKKAIVKTNKSLILSRMMGYASSNCIKSVTNEHFEKYETRYWFDKLMKGLRDGWTIKSYSNYTRGLYVSSGRDITYERLIEYAEMRRPKLINELAKKRKIEALRKLEKQHNLEHLFYKTTAP